MIKINNECVSKCLLHWKQTGSKYGEALAHSDGLNKHTVLVMWKTLEMKKLFLFFFYQKFCITLFTDSLVQNATIGAWIYSEPKCDAVTCLFVTVVDLLPLPPKSKNVRIRIFTHSNTISLLQNLINLIFSQFKIE